MAPYKIDQVKLMSKKYPVWQVKSVAMDTTYPLVKRRPWRSKYAAISFAHKLINNNLAWFILSYNERGTSTKIAFSKFIFKTISILATRLSQSLHLRKAL